MDSPSANTGTHILAPSLSSSGDRFDIEVKLEEEEPDLEPQDFKDETLWGWKWKKDREVSDSLKKREQETEKAWKWGVQNDFCVRKPQ